MKREGKRLLMDLLTNKVFSKLTLSEKFRIELFLNRGLEWALPGWKLIILWAVFVKQQVNCMTILRPYKRAVINMWFKYREINSSYLL